jgi:hypothetical protein
MVTMGATVSFELTAEPDLSVSCPVGRRGWSALDSADEAQLEAKFNRKVTFREALFGWLIEFNKY